MYLQENIHDACMVSVGFFFSLCIKKYIVFKKVLSKQNVIILYTRVHACLESRKSRGLRKYRIGRQVYNPWQYCCHFFLLSIVQTYICRECISLGLYMISACNMHGRLHGCNSQMVHNYMAYMLKYPLMIFMYRDARQHPLIGTNWLHVM